MPDVDEGFTEADMKDVNVDERYQRTRVTATVNKLIHVLKSNGVIPDPIAPENYLNAAIRGPTTYTSLKRNPPALTLPRRHRTIPLRQPAPVLSKSLLYPQRG